MVRDHFLKYKYLYIAVMAVSVIYVIPMLFVQLPVGHDIYFHMTRIDGLAEELKLWHFPARIYSTTLNDYGYASPLFYGDWLLYIPAYFVALGIPVATAYKGFIMLCAVLTAISMYFSAFVMFKNQRAAGISAIIYSLSTYLATDAIIRHANGEMQAFIFIPIAFAGLYNIIFNDCKKWLMLPLGLCGVLVTHTLSAAMTAVFLLIFALIFIIYFIKKPKKILYVMASAAVFFLFAASFVFPMIEQLMNNKFLATDGTCANYWGSLYDRAMPNFWSLFSLGNTTTVISTGKPMFVPLGVGLIFPILLIWRLLSYKKIKFDNGDFFAFFAAFALYASSRLFPWTQLQKLLGTMQFPWRIMVFATLFIAFYGGWLLKELGDGENVNAVLKGKVATFDFSSEYQFSILFLVATVISLFTSFSTLEPRYNYVYDMKAENKVIDYPFENKIVLGEFLPTGTNRGELFNRGETIYSDDEFSDFYIQRKKGVLLIEYSAITDEDTYVEVPLIMYKGYKAVLEKTDGTEKELAITYGENNVVRVELGDNPSGTIRVWYAGTKVQKISFGVSLLSFVVVIGWGLYLSERNKKIKKQKELTEKTILKPFTEKEDEVDKS